MACARHLGGSEGEDSARLRIETKEVPFWRSGGSQPAGRGAKVPVSETLFALDAGNRLDMGGAWDVTERIAETRRCSPLLHSRVS